MGKGKRKQIGGLESSATDGTVTSSATDGTSAKDTSLFSWVPSLSWFSSFFTSTQTIPVADAKNTTDSNTDETRGGKKHKKSVKKSKGKKHQKSAKR
jgi:hypothetical protein